MINILPPNDLSHHIESAYCSCNPTIGFVEGVTIIYHHSFDDKKFKEELPKMWNIL